MTIDAGIALYVRIRFPIQRVGDGATDVFGVVSNGQFNTWSYSKSATGSWADGYLQPALTNAVDGLVVADFNGDGFADVAANCDGPACWRISYGGFQD